MDIARQHWGWVFGLLIAVAGPPVWAGEAAADPAAHRPTLTQVWLAPDFASADMIDLFNSPRAWSTARERVSVMQFYLLQLLLPSQSPCPLCGDNRLPAFASADAFAKLKSWKIDLAVEAGVATCQNATYSAQAYLGGLNQLKQAFENVRRNGGQLEYIALDEPFFHGSANCKATEEDVLRSVLAWRASVLEFWPDAQIGEVEPYPARSVQDIERSLLDLLHSAFRPAFFKLDINFALLGKDPSLARSMPRDVRALRAFVEHESIPFGVIFWSGQDPVASGRQFDELTLRNLRLVKAAIGVPDIANFQSWVAGTDGLRNVPPNLPETSPGTLTSLVNEGVNELAQEDLR